MAEADLNKIIKKAQPLLLHILLTVKENLQKKQVKWQD